MSDRRRKHSSSNRNPAPRDQDSAAEFANVRPLRSRFTPWLLIPLAAVLLVAAVSADWWSTIPADATATFVGRQSCVSCHQAQDKLWQGSDHDLAMAPATAETVLGDFSNVTLEHYGTASRMYQADGRYWVETEGPDGQTQSYPIKYVFGVRPLQQYLVEFDRNENQSPHEEARLQVLRVSWDTEAKQWFHLDPPDVRERLAPDDPLHWTNSGQNWNHMCASCHSTNVHKGFDVTTNSYHTTFSEIDVSCEACHGPGSLHVQLAESKSLFWDRKRGYALRSLGGDNSNAEIHACAACHSRRAQLTQDDSTYHNYYDAYENELLGPETYYADGQIRDEVYVYGSFIQSKMYHKGIRCSDCHDPHSERLKAEGNQVCTSCHQHTAAKYDSPAHHQHVVGSTGSQCVECHMPASPFMQIDWRRDHSLRIPRPDLSVKWQTPNACTGCHLKDNHLASTRETLPDRYVDWLAAARDGDQEIANELARLDTWASEWVEKWYGKKDRPDHAAPFVAAWSHDAGAAPQLSSVVNDRDLSAMLRASALSQLSSTSPALAAQIGQTLLTHPHPLLRTAAVRAAASLPGDERVRELKGKLDDAIRLVRITAANTLADAPRDRLKVADQRALMAALDEFRAAQILNADQAGAHMTLGMLAERQGHYQEAVAHYLDGIHVQPGVTGPRSNLAELLQQQGDTQRATMLRREELTLMARDARLAPNHPVLQYRYGLALYLDEQYEPAVAALQRACELDPRESEFLLALTLLLERLQRYDEAWEACQRLLKLRPDDATLLPIRDRLAAVVGK